MRKNTLGGFLRVAALFGALTASAPAAVLLNLDLSTPNQLTITATSGLSAATVSGADLTGFYLQNFYGAPGLVSGSFANGLGNLTNAENPADGTPQLFRASVSDLGLNVWSWSTDSTVTFTANSLAFTGSATFALSAQEYAEMLGGSASGNIYFPAENASNITSASWLGTYTVTNSAAVPEPATVSLIGLGLGLVVFLRRR